MNKITVSRARTNNLKSISLEIERDKITVICGLSGSGKSSLAFDTLFAEGQRRFLESLSSYARQFLPVMEKPDCDNIDGLPPAICIKQGTVSHNPRSTVGTVTEIHDYLRLLYARLGVARCPEHKIELRAKSVQEIVKSIMNLPQGKKIAILAPVIRAQKGEHKLLLDQAKKKGMVRIRVDGLIVDIDDSIQLEKNLKHDIDFVIDRLAVKKESKARIADSIERATKESDGLVRICTLDDDTDTVDQLYSIQQACPHCDFSVGELEPRMFSFNSPNGACKSCDGLGRTEQAKLELMLNSEELTLEQGAIKTWTKRHHFYFFLLKRFCAHFKIPLNAPYHKLTDQQVQLIFNGSQEPVNVGFRKVRYEEFKGVLHLTEQRYQSTEDEKYRDQMAECLHNVICKECHGSKLNQAASNVVLENTTLPQLNSWTIDKLNAWISNFKAEQGYEKVAAPLLKEIKERTQFLIDVGLNYLQLDRSANTLSGGEGQRIRLASQIGSGLVGVMYVLDEPSIGLHERDIGKLVNTLRKLRDLNNTVIVVEHSEQIIEAADCVIDLGPGAGEHGGEICAIQEPKELEQNNESLTGIYLSKRASIAPGLSRTVSYPQSKKDFLLIKDAKKAKTTPIGKNSKQQFLEVKNAKGNNLQGVSAKIPTGKITCVTGVSGSGKSTLILDTFYPAVCKEKKLKSPLALAYDEVTNLDLIDKVMCLNQTPIGRTPRSNPATYVELFSQIRDLFSKTQDARVRGYKPGRFSFNVKEGRCAKCDGNGTIKVSMHFLPDVHVKCTSCNGTRYNAETLAITYKDLTIAEVLDLTVEKACEVFKNVPALSHKLQKLFDVGLGYIRLGQSATSFSGGEAQRVKIAKELAKRATGQTLYILDEPTTGLHYYDVQVLLDVLIKLKEQGNTLVIIEHNLDIIKNSDWLIDLGPEGGAGGGELIVQGTINDVKKCKKSLIGKFL